MSSVPFEPRVLACSSSVCIEFANTIWIDPRVQNPGIQNHDGGGSVGGRGGCTQSHLRDAFTDYDMDDDDDEWTVDTQALPSTHGACRRSCTFTNSNTVLV